jgi:hypothetical protein
MMIYRMHIANHSTNAAIIRTCRGIYAEFHKEMKDHMINTALQWTHLVIRDRHETCLSNVRIWQSRRERFALKLEASRWPGIYEYPIPSPELLGCLHTLSIYLGIDGKYNKYLLYKMMKDICVELVSVRRIKLSASILLFGPRYREFMCRVLLLFVALPTIEELCIENSPRLEQDLAVVRNMFKQNNVQYSDGSLCENDKFYMFLLG